MIKKCSKADQFYKTLALVGIGLILVIVIVAIYLTM